MNKERFYLFPSLDFFSCFLIFDNLVKELMFALIIVLIVEIMEIRRADIIILPYECELWVLANE